jgi:hypothetical protein
VTDVSNPSTSADPTDVLVRSGFWRFGAVRARLDLDGDRVTVTSVDPETGQPNSLIVSALLERITAFAAGRVITFEIEGNTYRLDLVGRDWPRRMSEWRGILEFAGLAVPYRSMNPVKAVLLTVAASILIVPYVWNLGLFVLTRITAAIVGIEL